MKLRLLRYALAALVLLVLPTRSMGYDPRLEWNTISTEHFDVHYHDGTEWTAQQVASIAEEIYPTITELYGYEPDRCNFVILDTDDYANGAAYFYDNKVEIWATNLEFGLRGTTEWLRNVVTHEYTHVVSIQAAMKMPRKIPALYFQAVDFEDEKRPDVITGYPNLIVSYPITGITIPPWWAEGVAQYQAPGIQSDCWDTHREMILRAAVTEDKMLSCVEMSYLGHKSLGNEQVYDHGYGLVNYIAETYGPESIREVSEELKKWYRLTIDGALEAAVGKGTSELYDDWREALAQRYQRQLQPLQSKRREGWVFNNDGYMTHSPTFSPDGNKVAFLSNKGSDFAGTSLYIADATGKNAKLLEAAVSSRPRFSPDGEKLIYGAHRQVDIYGAKQSDLFVYDLAREKSKRLTKKMRLAEPCFSPDATQIVAVQNGDGTHKMILMNADGSDPRVIFERGGGTQIYQPNFSPDGERILFGLFTGGTRDIATVDTDGGDFRYLVRTPNDERDASYSPDGRSVVFASDRTGIFNIYRLDLDDGNIEQLTCVFGGAFTPTINADGALAFASYTGSGYHVAMLDAVQPGPVETLLPVEYATRMLGEFDECVALKAREVSNVVVGQYVVDGPGQELASLDNRGGSAADATEIASDALPRPSADLVPRTAESLTDAAAAEPGGDVRSVSGSPTSFESHKYKPTYTDFQLFPRVVIWDGVPRLGAFVASNEILENQSFFFGGSYGTDGGYDAFIDFSFRRFFPVFFMQYFRMRQTYDDRVPIDDRLYYLDIRYDLWAASIGLRFEFADMYSIIHRNDIAVWWDYSQYKVFLDPEYTVVENGQTVRRPDQPAGWDYYRGNDFYLEWNFKAIKPAVDSDINPRGGRSWMLRFMYARDDLFTSGEFEYGFKPDYDKNPFGQYTLDYSEYLALPWWRHTLQVRLKASYIDNRVDDFFWYYVGGLDGLRGYTYYTMGGRAGTLASVQYRFPILRRINRQASWLIFKDIYGGAFFEIGNAWNDASFQTEGYKRAAGYELRLNLGSYYMYPTAISFIGAYALDRAVYRNPLYEFETIHEPQWRYYGTIGFTF